MRDKSEDLVLRIHAYRAEIARKKKEELELKPHKKKFKSDATPSMRFGNNLSLKKIN